MKKYYLLFTPLIFAACMDNAKPVALDKEYKAYGAIQNACLEIINVETPHCEEKHCEVLPTECSEFISVLEGANSTLKTMKKNKENAAFYAAKEKYKKEKKRLKITHKHLNLVLKKRGLDAIDSDNLEEFKEIIGFPYHPMNLTYYKYMRKNLSHFKNTKKYFKYEKKYALKKYQQGYTLANKGHYTRALTLLELSSDMNNIKASKLCGDVFVSIYPPKAKNCYAKGVALGDRHMLLDLAREYEKDKMLKEAYELYEKSAKAGNFIAQYKLYTLDKKLNVTWLKKSADTGYDKAQYDYGRYLAKHNEDDLAMKYLLLASDQGYTPAYYPLGKLYFSKKSYKKAYAYLSKGDSNADSLYKLAYLKEQGKGTSRNYYTAATYYKKSQKLGKPNVQKDINRVNQAKKRLRRAQIKQQKVQAKVSYEQINAKARQRSEVQKEDARLKAQWDARKEDARRLKVQACGDEPTSSNLARYGTRIHLEGTLDHWLGKSAFVIIANGKEYLVKDDDDNARLNKGDNVNMVAVSTGKREITHGLRRSIFDDVDEAAIEKAYALNYEGVCPY